MTRADERFLFTKSQGIERASKFSKHDLDDDQVLIALFINGENFGYDGCHLRQFLCLRKTNNKNQREHPFERGALSKDSVTPGAHGRRMTQRVFVSLELQLSTLRSDPLNLSNVDSLFASPV